MAHTVKSREKKPSAHQQRMRDFKESAYQILRRYQRGEFDSPSGVVAGQLDAALTTMLDAIGDAASMTFPHRSGGKERKEKR